MSEVAELQDSGRLFSRNQDSLKLFDIMNILRQESMKREIADKEKNTYLVCATQLGKVLEQEGEAIQKDIASLKNMLEQDYSLAKYDAAQDAYWRMYNPSFASTLDHLLFSLVQDEFSGLNDKHHVWNAVSWLWGKKKPLKEKVKLCDTILPKAQVDMSLLPRLDVEGLHFVEKGFCVEEGYVIHPVKKESLEQLVTLVSNSAMPGISFIADIETQEFLKKHFTGYSEKSLNDEVLKKMGLAPSFSWLKNQGTVAKYLTRYFLGQTSSYTTKQIQRWNGKENFNSKEGTLLSCITNGAVGVLGMGYYALGEALGIRLPLNEYWPVPITLATLSVAQYSIISSTLAKRHSGNIPGVILGFPLKVYLSQKEKKLDELCVIGGKIEEETAQALSNYHPIMKRMASHPVEESVESSLKWGPKNHHTHGKSYRQELQRVAEESSFGKNYYFSPELGVLTFCEVEKDFPYTKVSTLICQKGERWATTFITKKNEIDIDLLNQWAYDHQTVDQCLVDELAKVMNADYLHLTSYTHSSQGIHNQDYKVIA